MQRLRLWLLPPARAQLLRALGRSIALLARTAPAELRAVVVFNIAFGAGPAVALWLGKLVIDETARLATATPSAGMWANLSSSPTLLGSIVGFVLLAVLLDAIETLGSFAVASLRDKAEGALRLATYRAVAGYEGIALFETPALLDQKLLAEQSLPRVRGLVNVLTNLIIGVAAAAPSLALTAAIAWRAPLVLLAVTAPSAWAQLRYADRAWSVEEAQADVVREMHSYADVLTSATYAKELRLWRLAPLLLDRWQHLWQRAFVEMQQVRRQGTLAVVGLSLVSGLGAAVPYIYVIGATLAGQLSLGDLALYAGLIFQVRRALDIVLGRTATLYEVGLNAKAIFAVLDMPPAFVGTPPSSPTVTPVGEGGVAINNVRFTYPGGSAPVLADVTLSLRPNTLTVIVGENGVGKTTLAKLLCRLYDPQSGAITWNGHDLRTLDLQALRARIAVVAQDYARFPLSARENLAIGHLDQPPDDDTLWQAATAVGLERALAALPERLDTPLTKQRAGGAELSGGQWQRVAIARALLRRPEAELLLLDEPTAALDPATEHEVVGLLRAMARDRIAVVISHRLALARLADTVVVLRGGEIVEQGAHDALMALGGHYADLFTRQASGYLTSTAESTAPEAASS